MNIRTISIVLILILSSIWACFNIGKELSKNEIQQEHTPFGRDNYRAMVRDYNYAPEKVELARKKIKKQASKLSDLQKDAGLGDWESLGPTKIGGRVRAIATHPNDPNILWLGGVSGGIWKSNDKGASWVPKGDLLPSLAVTSILIHPTSPDTMYLSTGEGIASRRDLNVGGSLNGMPGSGIFRSFDGGNTWEKLPCITSFNESDFYWINKLIFNPTDPSKIYAAGHYADKDAVNQVPPSGAFRTPGILHAIHDHGNILIDSEAWAFGGMTDIDFNTADSKIWVGTTRDLLTFTLDNLGMLNVPSVVRGMNGFIADPEIGRVEIEIAPSNSNIIYALVEDRSETTFGFLMKSVDSGASWDTMEMKIFAAPPIDDVQPFKNANNQSQGWYDNTLWISPINANHIIIGGIELWRSEDGGDTFKKISDQGNYDFGTGTSPHADYHTIVQTADFGVSNTSIYVGNDGGIARAHNYLSASETFGWELINNNLSITQFYASDVRPGVGIIAGAQDNGTSFYDFSTDVWSEIWGNDGGYPGFGQGDTIYFSDQTDKFYWRDRNTGNQGALPFQLSDNPAFVAPMKSFDGGTKMLVADSLLWYSESPTDPFSFVNATPNIVGGYPVGTRISAIDVDANNRAVIARDDGMVQRTNNLNISANTTWQMLNNSLINPSFTGYVTDVAIHPDDFNKIAVALGGYRDDNIWITIDGGNTWVERSNGIPALHVNTLLWHHSEDDWLYAGTDLGVIATEDDGANWNVSPSFGGVSDGPIFTEVTNLQWGATSAANGARPLYVTTYGRGIWKTSDFIRGEDVYIDEDHVGFEFGVDGAPFISVEQAEAVQAHGQTWHIDGGTYTTSGSVILDKRLGEVKKTGTGSIVIGEN